MSFCYEPSSDLTLAATMRKGSLSYHGSHKLALDSPVVKYGAVFTVANMLANNGDFIQVNPLYAVIYVKLLSNQR